MIHVALVSAYLTEAEARAGIAAATHAPVAVEYRGIWRMPEPFGSIVHLFTDRDTEVLTVDGWDLVSSALPGDAPATHLLDREDR